MNEKYGIVTSMNLLLSSEFNALEIGHITENVDEYLELMKFFKRNINVRKPTQIIDYGKRPSWASHKWMELLLDGIKNAKINAWPILKGDTLQISAGRNHYSILIQDGVLGINACLKEDGRLKSESHIKTSMLVRKMKELTKFDVSLCQGMKPDSFFLHGMMQLPEKTYVVGLTDTKSEILKDNVIRFIEIATDFITDLASER